MILESQENKQKLRNQSRNQGSYIKLTFPKSKQGIEFVESKKLLNKILRDMFYVEFTAKGSPLPYPYDIVKKPLVRSVTETRAMSFTVRCKICTNFLEYSKKLDGQSLMYKLETFYSEHDHRLDQQRKVGYSHEKVALDYRTARQKRIFLNLNKYSSSTEDIERCIAELPVNMTKKLRETLICKKFNISINEFKNIYLKLNSRKEIQFADFIEDLQKKGYEYRYLPENLLKDNPKFSRKYQPTSFFSSNMPTQNKEMPTMTPRIDVDAKKTGNPFQQTKDQRQKANPGTSQQFAANPQPNVAQQSRSPNGTNPNIPPHKLSPHMVDPNNPNLPNVLLIVSPSMRQMYRKYGQFIGFDLTFSLIREQPSHTQKEYLVGVFASKNESLRIVIFGFVVTNNQSSEVYKWLFRSFMEIMGKHPQTIITDEEVAIGKAIRQLKEQGFYHGYHLLDTFHVLTKFRKAVEAQTFQYLRKMIHAKDKFQYKRLFDQTIRQLSSDDEIKVLQDFDYHCEKYCYAHIPPTFVGFGVSDAMNQSFHNILKDKIPYQIKYLKACNIILPFLEQRNQIGTLSLICEIPYEDKLGFRFLKPYRKILSDRVFYYLIIECAKAITHSLVLSEDRYERGNVEKVEEEEGRGENSSISSKHNKNKKKSYQGHYELNKALDKDKFQIVTKQGICLVWKQKIPSYPLSPIYQHQITCQPTSTYYSQYPPTSTYTTNTYPYSQAQPQFVTPQHKWRCVCQMEEKAGLCCSHILKLLVLRNESLMGYIHPRWFVMEENIYKGLGSFLRENSRIRFIENVTSDLSNLNRLKSIKLRGQYIHARNTIKRQLEGIVEEKIQPQPQPIPQEVRTRQRLLSSIRNKPPPQQKPIQPMNAAYLQWVSANDDTIKKQKQKYIKILQRKRKKQLKRIRIQGGYINPQQKFNKPSDKAHVTKERYVDYVYLKPNEMRQIEVKERERKERERLQGQLQKKRALRLSERRRLKGSGEEGKIGGEGIEEERKGGGKEYGNQQQQEEHKEYGQDEENMREQQIQEQSQNQSLQSNIDNSQSNSHHSQQHQPQQQIIDQIQQMLDKDYQQQQEQYNRQQQQQQQQDQVESSKLNVNKQMIEMKMQLDEDIQKLIREEQDEQERKVMNIEWDERMVDQEAGGQQQYINENEKHQRDSAFDHYFIKIMHKRLHQKLELSKHNKPQSTKSYSKFYQKDFPQNDQYENPKQNQQHFENQYQLPLSQQKPLHTSNNLTKQLQQNNQTKPSQQQPIKQIYNPFNKSYKKKLIENDDIVPREQVESQNRQDSDDDFDPKKFKKKHIQKTEKKEGGKKRGRPRIHPIKEPKEPAEKGQKGSRPRGRPIKSGKAITGPTKYLKNLNEQEIQAFYSFYGQEEGQGDDENGDEEEGSQEENEYLDEQED